MLPFNAESEKELSLSVGNYIVVRKVLNLLLETNILICNVFYLHIASICVMDK